MRNLHIIPIALIILLIIAGCKSSKVPSQEETTITQSGEGPPDAGPDNTEVFLDANRERILGNYEKAEKLYLKSLEINPGDDASMYELARIYRAQNRLDEAISYAEKAAGTDADNIYYQILLSNLYKQNSQFEKAIEVQKRIIEKNPDNFEYYNELAITYLFAGQYDEAIKIYDELEEKIGVTEEIAVQKQKIYLLQDEPEKAVRELVKLTEAFPSNDKYYSMLAELYLAMGKDKQALNAYMKVLEIDPDNAYIYISLADYYRKRGDREQSFEYLKRGFANPALDVDTKINILLAYYTASEFYEELKDEGFALSEILISTHPDDPKAYSIHADLLFRDERFEEAREEFRMVLSIDSSKYVVWEQLLFAEAELEDYDAMLNESRRASELFPNQPLPYLFSAVAYFQKENYNEAINILERGKKLVVGNDALLAQFYAYLGDAYHQTGQDEKAFETYEKTLKIDPDNSIVLNNYAYYLSLKGKDLEKAEKMAKKAVELDPDNSSNQDTYGWVLYKLGRYEEAETWIKKSVDNHQEDNAEVLEHYGDVLFRLGRNEEALEYWKRASGAKGETSEFLEKKIQDLQLYE
jgi:tetratricopeptide (TPR) repeat protein